MVNGPAQVPAITSRLPAGAAAIAAGREVKAANPLRTEQAGAADAGAAATTTVATAAPTSRNALIPVRAIANSPGDLTFWECPTGDPPGRCGPRRNRPYPGGRPIQSRSRRGRTRKASASSAATAIRGSSRADGKHRNRGSQSGWNLALNR